MKNKDKNRVPGLENLTLKELETLLSADNYNGDNQVISEISSNESFIDSLFQVLNNRHDIIYHFVMRYNDYISGVKEYSSGVKLSMIDMHTLTYIEDHPGLRITDLTEYWRKTKGAISQIVSRLEKMDLIKKVKMEGNSKNLHLYVTKEGLNVSREHKLFDILDIIKTLGKVREHCTTAEIDTFYKVLDTYYKVIDNDFELKK